MDFKFRHVFKAKNGMHGGGKRCFGIKGPDLVLPVPCGTIVYDESNNILADLCKEGEVYIVAQGGKGGLGNQHFATSVNQAPRYSQPGLPGHVCEISLELRLLAEVGLIGLPNAGKSTLLKVLTRANPKIAPYPFTTLFPNLGVLKFIDREIVLADIPGLVEGASEGVGLGHEFLRHVERTKLLVHMISVEPLSADICWDNYETISEELRKHNPDLATRPTVVVLNKLDILTGEEMATILGHFISRGVPAIAISAVTGAGIGELISLIQKGVD